MSDQIVGLRECWLSNLSDICWTFVGHFGRNMSDLRVWSLIHLECTVCIQCISPLTLWVIIPLRRGVLDTPLCDKVCQWLAASLWFSLCTLLSFTNKTDRHDQNIILLYVALDTITMTSNCCLSTYHILK
jgi:hypothetical protein